MVINENVERKIIPIASGKGGVGKSVIAANLAFALARNGKKTVVIDLDLGGSNLHTCLGLKNNHAGIGNFLSSNDVKFEDLMRPTPYKNLSFISGDVLVSGIADISLVQRKRIIEHILKLDAQYIIIDLGSGSSATVIDFFLISNSGLIVTTGQTIAILNAYSFLKNFLFRFLQRVFARSPKVSDYLKKIVREKNPDSSVLITEIVEDLMAMDPETGEKAKMYLSVLKPKLVVNMARSPEDIEIAQKLRSLVQKTLELELDCMGIIYADRHIDEALANRLPLMAYMDNSIMALEIERIALRIIESARFPEMPLDLAAYKDAYELAQIEAKYDYEELTKGEQESKPTLPDLAEWLALIGNQKKEIRELKSTIRMLTMKNPQG